MAISITIPRLGWNMEQGIFIGWLKSDGETIRAGESLFTLESEKSTEDVECLDAGILHIPPTGPRNGDTLAVGVVIGYLLQPGETPPAHEPPKPVVPAKTAVQPAASMTAKATRDRPAISPRARRAAARLGVDATKSKATGRTGRIRERDVLALRTPSVAPARRVIAERMLTSQRSTAPVTLTSLIDATELVRLRNQWKKQADVVPSFTDCFVKLAAIALGKHPALNARWDSEQIVMLDAVHIGIAVDTDAGLLVPVVRDVARLSLRELATRSSDLIERARQGKLAMRDMEGGTFTVTSLGAFGIDAFTPIINYPECAILGIGRIRRCPALVGDEVAIREQVTLSLTFDHRITDGAPAARFLQTLAGLVEKVRDVAEFQV